MEAYKEAFSTRATTKSSTIRVAAAKLLKVPAVHTRIDQLKAMAARRVAVTVESLVNELEEARSMALDSSVSQPSAAVGATMGKAKLLGFDKQTVEISGKNGGPVEVRTTAMNDIVQAFLALRGDE
jgi:hypothetical protein